MIKISVIKKYLLVGLFCLGLCTNQSMLPFDINNPLNLPAKMLTEIVPHTISMLAIAITGAIMTGGGAYILASGLAAKSSEKDTKEKESKKEGKTKPTQKSKKWSLRKVPGYVWAGLGLMITGIPGIIFSSKLADFVDSVSGTKPTPQESPQ